MLSGIVVFHAWNTRGAFNYFGNARLFHVSAFETNGTSISKIFCVYLRSNMFMRRLKSVSECLQGFWPISKFQFQFVVQCSFNSAINNDIVYRMRKNRLEYWINSGHSNDGHSIQKEAIRFLLPPSNSIDLSNRSQKICKFSFNQFEARVLESHAIDRFH